MSVTKIEVITDRRGNIVGAAPANTGKRNKSSAGGLPVPDAERQAFYVYVPRERQGLLIRDRVADRSVSENGKNV